MNHPLLWCDGYIHLIELLQVYVSVTPFTTYSSHSKWVVYNHWTGEMEQWNHKLCKNEIK